MMQTLVLIKYEWVKAACAYQERRKVIGISYMPEKLSNDRIAYLAGEYPAGSHTFILREVAALRDLGHDVLTCSVRDVAAKNLGPEEQEAAVDTFFILRDAKKLKSLFAAQVHALKKPMLSEETA